MDLRKIKKLIELVEESGIAELEVSSGDESVRIAMRGSGAAVMPAPAPVAAMPQTLPGSAAREQIDAPMAGTFYRAPHPDAEPYVAEGAVIEVGTVVCIIESMKMMHEIKAAVSGRVAEVCVPNGTPVGTGETLFKLS